MHNFKVHEQPAHLLHYTHPINISSEYAHNHHLQESSIVPSFSDLQYYVLSQLYLSRLLTIASLTDNLSYPEKLHLLDSMAFHYNGHARWRLALDNVFLFTLVALGYIGLKRLAWYTWNEWNTPIHETLVSLPPVGSSAQNYNMAGIDTEEEVPLKILLDESKDEDMQDGEDEEDMIDDVDDESGILSGVDSPFFPLMLPPGTPSRDTSSPFALRKKSPQSPPVARIPQLKLVERVSIISSLEDSQSYTSTSLAVPEEEDIPVLSNAINTIILEDEDSNADVEEYSSLSTTSPSEPDEASTSAVTGEPSGTEQTTAKEAGKSSTHKDPAMMCVMMTELVWEAIQEVKIVKDTEVKSFLRSIDTVVRDLEMEYQDVIENM
eukprot:TRINITY_DN1293_c0_g1_i3.p1 TRINITY_DN1293_c0_g1~~TRINITY_DN1293_c0_g1_i3.p1  ORF type:complete len:410 (-),score=87.57 TRINITY_DN1293_c0_g1_i3:221-1357(-)